MLVVILNACGKPNNLFRTLLKQRIILCTFKNSQVRQDKELFCCIPFVYNFYLINIYIFDYPDSKLSGLFTEVPAGLNNQGLTVLGLYRGAHGTQILPIDWSSTHE